ncbi:hypothetical protein MMC34_004692 [Xylographa carneopallida]|nr:hypothetical protein [Xylographa carneopallida]
MTSTSPLEVVSYPTQITTNATANSNSSGLSSAAKAGIGVGITLAALLCIGVGLAAGYYFRRTRIARSRSIRLPETENGNELLSFGYPKNGNIFKVAVQPRPLVEMEGDGLKPARFAELRG